MKSVRNIFSFSFPLIKKAINIFVRDLGEERVLVEAVIGRIRSCLVEDRGYLIAAAFCADSHKALGRAFVKYNDQQAAADNADEYALSLAFVKYTRKRILANKLCHAACGGDVAGRQARKARRVHIGDLAVKSYGLAVAVDKKNDAGRTLGTEPRQDGFEPLKLMFL